ncbi:MAG: hypothetical protein KDD53_07805, partial [Bdellovibrionales bacterium]|nr:hypothetical protein [Bdellovibrionales bacterium]
PQGNISQHGTITNVSANAAGFVVVTFQPDPADYRDPVELITDNGMFILLLVDLIGKKIDVTYSKAEPHDIYQIDFR